MARQEFLDKDGLTKFWKVVKDYIANNSAGSGSYLPLSGGAMDSGSVISSSGNLTVQAYNDSALFFGSGNDTICVNSTLDSDSGAWSIGKTGSGRFEELNITNNITSRGFVHEDVNSDEYVLLAGGGTKALSEFNTGSGGSGSSGSMSTLTIQVDGNTVANYDGSANKTVNITCDNIGAVPVSSTLNESEIDTCIAAAES